MRLLILVVTLLVVGMAFPATVDAAAAVRPYDYHEHPVVATDPDAAIIGPCRVTPAAAVDGDGGGSTSPYATSCYMHLFPRSGKRLEDNTDFQRLARHWVPDASLVKPAKLTLDYGQPVAAAKFAIYFPVQGNQDIRLEMEADAALPTDLEILRSDDGKDWQVAAKLSGDRVPWTSPLVVDIPSPKSARYYQLVINKLAPGTDTVLVYEVETYVDPAARIPRADIAPKRFAQPPKPRYGGATTGKFSSDGNHAWRGIWSVKDDGLDLTIESGRADLAAEVKLLPDGETPREPWRRTRGETIHIATPVLDGYAGCALTPDRFGLRLRFTAPPLTKTRPRQFVQARISVPNMRVRFMPPGLWFREPAARKLPAYFLTTNTAILQTDKGSLAVVPATDMCFLAIDQDSIVVDMLPDAGDASVLLIPVDGDWWKTYQIVVKEVFHFAPRKQYERSTTEVAMGGLKWLMSDACWFKEWDYLRSWRAPSDAIWLYYGVPYTVPAMWQRYLLTGDRAALSHLDKMMRFMLQGPMRVKEGPMKGGYYSHLMGTPDNYVLMTQQITTKNKWMTTHATGAALWALVYHRRLLGHPDAELDKAITESADFLLRHQNKDGGWFYAYREDGSKPSAEVIDSGTIWNVWALYRAGQLLDRRDYLQAAQRGKAWWLNTWTRNHRYRGFYEDLVPDSTGFDETRIGSVDGYEQAVGVLAFLEMGDRAGAMEVAKDLAPFVQTRTPGYLDYWTSYGCVPESCGYTPSYYCAGETGIALQLIYQLTDDPFWKPYASICKTITRFSDADTGAIFHIEGSNHHVPYSKGRPAKNYNLDWTGAHDITRALWWLIEEINGRTGGSISVDRERMTGTVFGRPAKAWLPENAPSVMVKGQNELNWMGYKTDTGYYLVVLNDHPSQSGRVTIRPKKSFVDRPAKIIRVADGERAQDVRTVMPRPTSTESPIELTIPSGGLAIVEW